MLDLFKSKMKCLKQSEIIFIGYLNFLISRVSLQAVLVSTNDKVTSNRFPISDIFFTSFDFAETTLQYSPLTNIISSQQMGAITSSIITFTK